MRGLSPEMTVVRSGLHRRTQSMDSMSSGHSSGSIGSVGSGLPMGESYIRRRVITVRPLDQPEEENLQEFIRYDILFREYPFLVVKIVHDLVKHFQCLIFNRFSTLYALVSLFYKILHDITTTAHSFHLTTSAFHNDISVTNNIGYDRLYNRLSQLSMPFVHSIVSEQYAKD